LVDFKRVDSTVLQEVSKRVEKTFKRFIAGDSKGKKSGKPRFNTSASWQTMTFATAKNEGLKLIRKNWLYLHLPKIGAIKIRMHRELPAGCRLKQVSVTRKADGWYIQMML
jgi:putative transposase